MATSSARWVTDRARGKVSSSKPTTWPGISKATCIQATRALAASRKWLRLRSKLLLQLLQSVPRGCESVSGSCRRWVQFDIGFKGPDGVAQVPLTYQVLAECVQSPL